MVHSECASLRFPSGMLRTLQRRTVARYQTPVAVADANSFLSSWMVAVEVVLLISITSGQREWASTTIDIRHTTTKWSSKINIDPVPWFGWPGPQMEWSNCWSIPCRLTGDACSHEGFDLLVHIWPPKMAPGYGLCFHHARVILVQFIQHLLLKPGQNHHMNSPHKAVTFNGEF